MGNQFTVHKTDSSKYPQQNQINVAKISATPQVPDSLLLYNKNGKPLRIMVNPGHGEKRKLKDGTDYVATGATRPAPQEPSKKTYKIAGYNRTFSNDTIYEMNLNDSVAQRVSKNLKKYGAHIVYADNLTLKEIRKMQKDSCVNSFIAIHHNTDLDTSTKGSATYSFGKSLPLANAINENLKTDSTISNLGTKSERAKQLYVLKKSKNAVLVECDFMSSPEELKKITTAEYYDKMADNITNGLLDYYLGKDKAAPKKIHHKKVEKKPEKFEIKMMFDAKPKQPLSIYPPYQLYQK